MVSIRVWDWIMAIFICEHSDRGHFEIVLYKMYRNFYKAAVFYGTFNILLFLFCFR